MVNLEVEKSYAFITAYLLGVEKKVLERDYIEDYIYSENLEKLKQVENAELLRILSRVKQSFIRNYGLYKNVSDLTSVTTGHLDEEIKLLEENGIKLNNQFRINLDITDVLNLISKNINRLLEGVLSEFNIPHIKQVSALFYLYEVNKKSLAKLTTTIKDNWNKFPHGIVIIKGSKALQQLPYALQHDENLFKAGYTLTGEKYVETKVEHYKWSTIISKSDIPTLPIRKGTTMYVDCDNTDYTKFLGVLNSLNSSTHKGETHHIKLFLDAMTSQIWNLTANFVKGCFSFEFIVVPRIKENKSVVDMVIATHMTKDSILIPNIRQGLVSSDSDFFGLMEGGLKFFVLYNAKSANFEYLNYLKRKKVVNYDISNLGSDDVIYSLKQSIISHLCLKHLSSLPMAKWKAQDLAEFVCSSFDKEIEFGLEFNLTEAQNCAHKVLEDLKVVTEGSKVLLSSLGADVEVELGVA